MVYKCYMIEHLLILHSSVQLSYLLHYNHTDFLSIIGIWTFQPHSHLRTYAVAVSLPGLFFVYIYTFGSFSFLFSLKIHSWERFFLIIVSVTQIFLSSVPWCSIRHNLFCSIYVSVTLGFTHLLPLHWN
jgi:hypothetical protein